jgi:tRNA (mo5U34)-methyltransferase
MEQTQLSETNELRRCIADLGPWFHNLHLPDGTQTFPDHPLGDFPALMWAQLEPHLPEDLTGWRVLDIGCNAGFYTIKLAQRGAHVIGIDVDDHYLAQARWAAQQLGVAERTEFRRMQVYDLARTEERYDLVLFLGVFYHLRYPMLGLDIVAQKVRRLLVFQTLHMPGDEVYELTDGLSIRDCEPMREPGWPKLAFIEHRLADDPTNWWAPNQAAVLAMLRASGMRPRSIGWTIYLAEPDPDHPSCVTTWNRDEFLSATGQSDVAIAERSHHD